MPTVKSSRNKGMLALQGTSWISLRVQHSSLPPRSDKKPQLGYLQVILVLATRASGGDKGLQAPERLAILVRDF